MTTEEISEKIKDTLDQFVGDSNTTTTRQKIVDAVSSILSTIPNSEEVYKIICDETNNPVSIIEERKLKCKVIDNRKHIGIDFIIHAEDSDGKFVSVT
jgi:ABC-type antimicrobial peptide transport system permease subunit